MPEGYVFVDGRYIDAPYVVEQRGYIIFINDVKTEPGVDVRKVLPPAPEAPVTRDPGAPTGLARKDPVHKVLMHPVVESKQQYWSHIGLYGEERVRATIEYFESLPCVAKVEDTRRDGSRKSRKIYVYDHQGGKIGTYVPLEPWPERPQPTDEELYRIIMRSRRIMETRLKGNGAVFFRGGRILASYPGVKADARWQNIFRTFASEASPEEKVRRLKTLGFLPEHKRVESAVVFYPVKDFKASDQIWKRLAGDEAWDQGMADVLYEMTNGWQRIPPKFERPEVAEMPVAEPHEQISEPFVADEVTTKQAGTSAARPTANVSARHRRGWVWPALGGMGIVAIVLCAVWLGRRCG